MKTSLKELELFKEWWDLAFKSGEFHFGDVHAAECAWLERAKLDKEKKTLGSYERYEKEFNL